MADTKTSAETRLTALSGGDLVRVSEAQGTSPETYQTKATTAEVMGHQFRGARVKLGSNLTSINATTAYPIPWDAEDYDPDGFHSTVTNTERLTIPAGLGITNVEVKATVTIGVATANDTTYVDIVHYNSADSAIGAARQVIDTNNATFYGQVTYEGAVSDGDYFVARYNTTADTSTSVTASIFTWFSIRVTGMAPV